MDPYMQAHMDRIPDNIRALRPVEVVLDQPTNAELKEQLDQIAKDIADTKALITLVVEQVKPTLDMLSTGPIGQILGIAPPPEPRRRGRH